MEKRFMQLERFSESKKAVLSNGIVCAIPFVFSKLWLLSWVSFVPLAACFLDNERVNAKQFAHLCFRFGFGFYFLGYVWLGELYPFEYLGIGHALALLLLALAMTIIPAFHACILAAAGYVCRRAADRASGVLRLLAFPCVFVLAEYLQSLGTFAFPWCRLFVTQSACPALLQSASLFGSYFITYLILLVNALLVKCDEKPFKKRCVLALALFIANLAFGMGRMAFEETQYQKKDAYFSAVVLQGNYPYNAKQNDPVSSIYTRYMSLADAALTARTTEAPTLILLPETALPTNIANADSTYARLLSSVAVRKQITISAGAFSVMTDPEGEKTYGNSIFTFTPDGAMSKPYSKRHLVPFGEYLPYRGLFDRFLPMVSENAAFSVDLSPGHGTVVQDTPCGRVGAIVCYESVFGDICRKSVSDGAEILLVATNDSTFGSSQALRHHLAQAQMRAVENNVPVLRAANTGISALIAPNGRVVRHTEPDETAFLTDTLPYGTGRTLYNMVGDGFLWLLAGGLLIIGIKNRRSSRIGMGEHN